MNWLSRRPVLFPEKREAFFVESQEDMNFDGTPLKAPSASRRRIMPPTPQQSPQPTLEGTPLRMEVEDQEFGACEKEYEVEHRWTARDREVIAKVEQYLCESDNMKVEVVELELLFGPEDSEVELWYILDECEEEKGSQDLSNLQLAGSQRVLGSQRGAMGRVLEDARETGGRVPRAQQGHQIHE